MGEGKGNQNGIEARTGNGKANRSSVFYFGGVAHPSKKGAGVYLGRDKDYQGHNQS
jgi:hypothetical protein